MGAAHSPAPAGGNFCIVCAKYDINLLFLHGRLVSETAQIVFVAKWQNVFSFYLHCFYFVMKVSASACNEAIFLSTFFHAF